MLKKRGLCPSLEYSGHMHQVGQLPYAIGQEQQRLDGEEGTQPPQSATTFKCS